MSSKIRVAIVGVGNCASSFVQGVTFYAGARGEEPISGLMHNVLGGYAVGDIELAEDAETGPKPILRAERPAHQIVRRLLVRARRVLPGVVPCRPPPVLHPQRALSASDVGGPCTTGDDCAAGVCISASK